MSNTSNVKQLQAVVRILSNIDFFLKNGLYQGGHTQKMAEAQAYVEHLLKQTSSSLQAILEEKLADKDENVEKEAKEKADAVSKG